MPTPRPSTSASNKAPSVKSTKTPSVKAPSRTPTPLGPVNVPMGAVAWASKTTDDWEMIEKNGNRTKNGKGKRGLITGGMTSCFTVIVVGASGAIMSHVSAYLANAKALKKEDELKTLKSGVEKMWKHAEFTSSTVKVIIIRGPSTAPEETGARQKLTNEIFPQVAKLPSSMVLVRECVELPTPMTALHGTAEVRMPNGTIEIYREGVKEL